MEAKVCTQCGAPLRGNKCAYCGTEFVSPTHIYKYFHFNEPITVEQEPERIIPVSEPDVLTEADVSMIKKEKRAQAVSTLCAVTALLITAFIIIKIMFVAIR